MVRNCILCVGVADCSCGFPFLWQQNEFMIQLISTIAPCHLTYFSLFLVVFLTSLGSTKVGLVSSVTVMVDSDDPGSGAGLLLAFLPLLLPLALALDNE